MLRLKTKHGVKYVADLLELCEEAAGPRARPEDVTANLAGVVQRLLALHTLDDQTAVLLPLFQRLNRPDDA